MDEDSYGPKDDVFARLDYRRFIAWPKRIQREAPFLLSALEGVKARSVLDLGCGTGEHARFLHGQGFEVFGIDKSPSMISKAREGGSPAGLTFLEGDLCDLRTIVDRRFGGAISLGNTLVHITDRRDFEHCLQSVRTCLAEDGVFVFQILNYERIFERKIRYLPLNFSGNINKEEPGEIIFLRLMELLPDNMVRFYPTTLTFDPTSEQPVQVSQTRCVHLRGWTSVELLEVLGKVGFESIKLFGDMSGGPYRSMESTDLVVIACG